MNINLAELDKVISSLEKVIKESEKINNGN